MPSSRLRALTRAPRLLAAVAIVFVLVSSARAQTPQGGNLRLAALKFSGLEKIDEKQAAAGTGLHIGDPITITQLSVVADQMAKTGAFARVAFQYSTKGDDLTAIFTVVENKPLLPCLFDNFVWFSSDQLDKALRAQVPFYSGVIPMTGAMQQQIQEALRNLMESHGVSADVQVLPSPGPGGMGQVMLFRASGTSMPIKQFSFPGSASISETELEGAAAKAIGQDFSVTNSADFASAVLIPVYRNKGYLRATFERPQWTVIGNPPAGSPPDIAVTLPVKEGAQFSWDKVDWSGNEQLSKDQLEQALAMTHGDVANQQKIDDGFRAVKKSYDKLGCIDAKVQPRAILDDSKLLASYDVAISEGVQYHMGRVLFAGIPVNAATDLTAKWQLKPGAIYDATYPSEFVDRVAVPRLQELGIRKTASFGLRRNTQAATVDVDIVFH